MINEDRVRIKLQNFNRCNGKTEVDRKDTQSSGGSNITARYGIKGEGRWEYSVNRVKLDRMLNEKVKRQIKISNFIF